MALRIKEEHGRGNSTLPHALGLERQDEGRGVSALRCSCKTHPRVADSEVWCCKVLSYGSQGPGCAKVFRICSSGDLMSHRAEYPIVIPNASLLRVCTLVQFEGRSSSFLLLLSVPSWRKTRVCTRGWFPRPWL